MQNLQSAVDASISSISNRLAAILTFPADIHAPGIGLIPAMPVAMTPKELRARTAEFARMINLFCRPLLLRPETRSIAEQLLDSSSSVASNHRAAGRGRSHAEFTAKIGIVDEEADESLYWLEHLRDCKLVKPEEVGGHIREASELSAIFTTSAKTARANDEADRAARQRPKRRKTK